MSEIKKDYKDKDLCLPKKITSHEPTAIKRDQKLKKVSVKRRIIRGPAEGQYQKELHINGLMTQDVDTPDLTRNGVARGSVIVGGPN